MVGAHHAVLPGVPRADEIVQNAVSLIAHDREQLDRLGFLDRLAAVTKSGNEVPFYRSQCLRRLSAYGP